MQESRPPSRYNSIGSLEWRARLSRRRLLASAAAIAVAGTALGPGSQRDAPRDGSTMARPGDDRRQRLAAILQRHGPEFGHGR